MVLQRSSLPFFILRIFKVFFWKTIDFVENLEMTQTAMDGMDMFFASLSQKEYDNLYVIHPFLVSLKT